MRSVLASFVLAATMLVAARADAADVLRLSWDAPAGCPSGETVRAAAVKNAPASAVPLEADAIVAHRDRWTVTLRTRRSEGSGERVLEAASCRALADATAVILALALVPPGEDAANASASSSASASTSAPASASTPASAPDPAPTSPPSPPSPPAAERPSPASSANASSRSPGRPAIAIAAFGASDAASLPGVALGGGGALAWTPNRLRIEASASVFAGPSQTVDQSTAGARFSMTSLAAGACYTVVASAIEIAPCAGGSVHWVSAEGFGATTNYDASARWVAIDGGLLARAPLTSWLALRARADGLVPLGRPSFQVENEGVVHQPPPLGIRAALGVELNFL